MAQEITIPDIGSTGDVTVIEVNVKPGDTIQVDQPLITLEGDKATMEIPALAAGKVESVAVKVGDKVKMGSVILRLQAETKEPAPKAAEKPAPVETAIVAPVVSAPAPAVEQKTSPDADIYASPGVRRLAHELGIDLSVVAGTGRKERIQKEDLQTYIRNMMQRGGTAGGGAGLPAAPVVDFSKFGETETKPLTKIKKLTATNLHRNWVLVPHVTQFEEADITNMEAFRKAQGPLAEKQGIKLTPLVFMMKAVVAALKDFPQFNASLDATGENLIFKKYFHIGVAVDTPDGLVVPVIRDVDKKGLFQLAKELGDISAKARNKQLTPNEMQGSSFTISSLGGIGGTAFTPIVNLPDVAILGVSKAAMKPVYQDGQFVPRLMLPLSLSYDHRVIDGAEGARFVVQLAKYLADLKLLLL